MKSYLLDRSQYVAVGAGESVIRPVRHGVPQGSVLGPTLYNLYINEMADTINEYDHVQTKYNDMNVNLFKDDCHSCGSLPSYADDSTFVCSSSSRQENQNRITEVLEKLRLFLNTNQLTINKSKTVLLESMLYQRRTTINGEPPTLETIDEKGNPKIISTNKEALLLGGTFHESTSWKAHIETGDEAILPKLRKKLGMLKFISRGMDKKSKLLLANAYIISRIIYLLPLWGGTSQKYLNKVQVVLNNTARWVTGHGRRSKSEKLMSECKWLNLKNLLNYILLSQCSKL